MSSNVYQFKPLNIGRVVVWSVFALVLAVSPVVFTSSLSHTMLSQRALGHRLPKKSWGLPE